MTAACSQAWTLAKQYLFERVFAPCSAGGEGATAREVLRHKSVEKVVMVDIDKVCMSVVWQDMCQLALSPWILIHTWSLSPLIQQHHRFVCSVQQLCTVLTVQQCVCMHLLASNH